MAEHQQAPAGPDLTKGVPASDLRTSGHLAGHVGDKEVLLVQLACVYVFSGVYKLLSGGWQSGLASRERSTSTASTPTRIGLARSACTALTRQRFKT